MCEVKSRRVSTKKTGGKGTFYFSILGMQNYSFSWLLLWCEISTLFLFRDSSIYIWTVFCLLEIVSVQWVWNWCFAGQILSSWRGICCWLLNLGVLLCLFLTAVAYRLGLPARSFICDSVFIMCWGVIAIFLVDLIGIYLLVWHMIPLSIIRLLLCD